MKAGHFVFFGGADGQGTKDPRARNFLGYFPLLSRLLFFRCFCHLLQNNPGGVAGVSLYSRCIYFLLFFFFRPPICLYSLCMFHPIWTLRVANIRKVVCNRGKGCKNMIFDFDWFRHFSRGSTQGGRTQAKDIPYNKPALICLGFGSVSDFSEFLLGATQGIASLKLGHNQ